MNKKYPLQEFHKAIKYRIIIRQKKIYFRHLKQKFSKSIINKNAQTRSDSKQENRLMTALSIELTEHKTVFNFLMRYACIARKFSSTYWQMYLQHFLIIFFLIFNV